MDWTIFKLFVTKLLLHLRFAAIKRVNGIERASNYVVRVSIPEYVTLFICTIIYGNISVLQFT